ncbi:hypothetical protein BJV82DRAFT_600911 [Fennellomyces sp. T-0311]|nr:hypothetical protein BJV82DRAFT_600911 [Fennellomyces sp. T-0311]
MPGDDADHANAQQCVQSPIKQGSSVSKLTRILKDHNNPLRSYFLGVFLGGGTMAKEKSRYGLVFPSISCIELYQFLTSYGVTLPKLKINVGREIMPKYRAGFTARVSWRSNSKKLATVLENIVSNWSKKSLRPQKKSKRRICIALFILGFIWPAGLILFESIGDEDLRLRGVDIDADKEMRKHIQKELESQGIDDTYIQKYKKSQSLVINGNTAFKKLLMEGLLELERQHMPLPGKLQLLHMSLIHPTLPYDVLPSGAFTSFFNYLGKQGHMDPVFAVIAQDLISLTLYEINIIFEAIGHKTIQSTSDVDLVQFVKWTFNHMRNLPSMTPCQDLFALYTKVCLERQASQEKTPLKDVPADGIQLGYIYDDVGELYSKTWKL